jgi:restriction system protein
MGRIVFSRANLNGELSEIVGYKAGLALNEDQMASHVDEDYRDLILGDRDQIVTVRSEEAEEIVSQLLYGVGNTPVRHRVSGTAEVMRAIRREGGDAEVLEAFQRILLEEFKAQEGNSGPYDYTPVLTRADDELGLEGGRIALMWLEATEISLQQNPWSRIRHVAWSDTARLSELFESESLQTSTGTFIDQRFIDYLARNGGRLDDMNWRKFEGLACEFFERAGFHVEIGEGRADGGVDARIWPDKSSCDNPPAILVQCKRQKQKIGQVVVKALWADVVDEKASSGLIVTTSALERGAAAVCEARAYPIAEANRKTVTQWLEVMRSPNTGVFLAR